MKRLLYAASAVLLSLITNAASVSWSVTNIQATPTGKSPAQEWVCYVLAGSTYDAFTALNVDKKVEYIKANSLASGSLTYQSRFGTYSAGIKEGSYDKGEEASAYMIFFDAENVQSAGYMAYTTVATTTIGITGADTSLTIGTFSDVTGTTGGWQSIPEPTSGLLMLLGMGGLALRRKQK